MVKSELIKRSPLRILEKSIQGGLGKGNVGVFASRKGVGKTACLVHVATDKLFQGKVVIHVSYSSRVDYIINWYEHIFKEIAKKRQLEAAVDVHNEIIKNRVIMNFQQDGARTERVLSSLEAMIVHGKYTAEVIIFDGYDFSGSNQEDFHKIREFAKKLGMEVWFSASLKGDDPLFDEKGAPFVLQPFMDDIDVLITLGFKDEYIGLNLIKSFDQPALGLLPLKLDPNTLLIAE
jgi:hypothetical protein